MEYNNFIVLKDTFLEYLIVAQEKELQESHDSQIINSSNSLSSVSLPI